MYAQKSIEEELPFTTALKINVNGLKLGIEQKIFKKTTIQFEAGYLGRSSITMTAQIRKYFLIHNTPFYLGLGYFYKNGHYNARDSVKMVDSAGHYMKDFSVGKYIHAITIVGGYFFERRIFKHRIRYELGFGAGVRFKKSTRYGLLPNETVDNDDHYIIRPQQLEDTKGKFKLYPELNIVFRVLLPLKK